MRWPPDLGEQLAVRHHHAEVPGEAGEQAELDRREMHRGAAPGGLALFEVDPGFSEIQLCPRGRSRRMAQSGAHAREQLADAEWLGDVVVGAGVERLDLRALLDARREHHDRHRRPLADAADHLDAVEVRQAEVDDREVGLVHAGVERAAPPVGRLHDAVALGAERRAQEAPDMRLVLDHQNGCIHRASTSTGISGGVSKGKANLKAVPTPGSRSAQMRPPWSAMIARQIASPRPTPPRPPWRNLSNRLSRSPSGRPGPKSSTDTTSSLAWTCARRRTSVRAGVWRAAFSSRLPSACSMRAPSTRASGRSPGMSTMTRWSARRGFRRRTTEAAISPIEHQSRSSVSPPLSRRVICSTLATSSDIA